MVASINGRASHQTKINDLRTVRDRVKVEAELAQAQIHGIKAKIFDTFRKIERKNRKAVKKAAKNIVKSG